MKLTYGRKKKMAAVDGKARLVDDRGWFIGPPDGLDIGEVYCTASQNEEVQESFARLFAASPRVLAALKLLLASPMLIGNHPEARAAYDECNAAIAESEKGQ